MKKKKLAIMTLALSSVVAVTAGCTSDETKDSKEKMSEKEEKAYIEKFSEKVLKPESPSVIMKEIEENVNKVSKQEASNMIDGLLFSMHQPSAELNTKIQGLQANFAKLEKDGIDFNNPKNLEKVKDETTKAFLKDAQSKKYIVTNVNDTYLARPDIKFVIDTYGSYMNDDLKAISEFSLDENQKPFYNQTTNNFDMDIVVSRIQKIEDNMKKFPDSFYQEAMKNSKNYYYQVYFGTNNSFLVDDKKQVLDAVVKHYEDTVKKYPDSKLAKDTQSVLDKLKETKNIITDDLYVYLLEMTGTKTENVDSEEKADSTNKVQEAVDKAIEENKESNDKK